MTEAAKKLLHGCYTDNNILSAKKIVNLLSESELEIIVGKNTIAITLNNLGYRYKSLNLESKTIINKK